jgi:glycyl-tRNA synthetase
LEVAIGIDRVIYTLIVTNMNYREKGKGKQVLALPWHLAPVQVSVLPLVKNKPELLELSLNVYDMLKRNLRCHFDKRQAIGKRYLKSAIRGIPIAVTIDFDSLEDNTVTIRNRDTEEQYRVNIDELLEKLQGIFRSSYSSSSSLFPS